MQVRTPTCFSHSALDVRRAGRAVAIWCGVALTSVGGTAVQMGPARFGAIVLTAAETKTPNRRNLAVSQGV